jgi:hypothetical protein
MLNMDDSIKKALALAKSGRDAEALALLEGIEIAAIASESLRKLALVYSYCHEDLKSEECWMHILERGEARSGDWFMLGSIQAGLAKYGQAIANLSRELQNSRDTKSDVFLVSSGILLASLLIDEDRFAEANDVLNMLGPNDSYYVRGQGNVTASRLREKLRSR